MFSIDLTKLTEAQLEAFALIDAPAAYAERNRRNAYESVSELFSELAQVGLTLEAAFENHTKSVGVKAIRESRILVVIQKALAYAENHDIPFTQPKLVVDA